MEGKIGSIGRTLELPMSDELVPLSLNRLAAWISREYQERGSIFGLSKALFFRPRGDEPWAPSVFGARLETPVGVAAGPHTQMAQNLVIAWLSGARVMELKTVQVLDALTIARPCIDMEDEGYNVEWSQELKLAQSYREYLNAWVLIHALHRQWGLPGSPGVLFNASVGYEMKGLMSPAMQTFMAKIQDISADLPDAIRAVSPYFPAVCEAEIPARMCHSVTLSTMHGTPPAEIEALALHLLEGQGLHTFVKLNPTLLGREGVRGTLARLNFREVVVPDAAFEHDPTWDAAEPMLWRLQARAAALGLVFGVKLTNTLEVLNHRGVFPASEGQMYLSGRPLHAISVQVAALISTAFSGRLPMSFAGGADAFRVAPLLAGGMQTVTTCSDLLKSGGYGRLPQYLEELDRAWGDARDAEEFAVKVRAARPTWSAALAEALGAEAADLAERLAATDRPLREVCAAWALAQGCDPAASWEAVVRLSQTQNLAHYATHIVEDDRLNHDFVSASRTKSAKPLGFVDCISAPCTDACAVDQEVPAYMRAVREGDWARAVEVVRAENPLGATLSHICDRQCQTHCVRTHYDQPLLIREVKRAILSHERRATGRRPAAPTGRKVAVVGGGPLALCAVRELHGAGYACTIIERSARLGGTVAATIPAWRLPDRALQADFRALEELGVEVQRGVALGRDTTLAELRAAYDAVLLATGAQVGKRLGLPGDDAPGVMDAFGFLARVKAGEASDLGARVAVIGAGDVAMDAARTAWRMGREVVVLYRRTAAEAPADPEELQGLLDEGIPLRELVAPVALRLEGGRLAGLQVQRMELGPKGSDGRRGVQPVEGAFEELALDSLLVAVSQRSELEWASELTLHRWGAIAVDPVTSETSLSGVFAGGDVADDGPASAVRACGDGKRIAAALRARFEGELDCPHEALPLADYAALDVKKARRAFPVAVPHLHGAARQSFAPVMQTLSEPAARAEAERCLDCDTYCSTCVTVCPNRAIFTYFVEPFKVDYPRLEVSNETIQYGGMETHQVAQAPQVAIMADWCNQCGNCATFCPTSGKPWRDKPRLYLSAHEYAGDSHNAWLLRTTPERWTLLAKFDGAEHSLVAEGDVLRYRAYGVESRFQGLYFVGASALSADASPHSLATAALMIAFLRGLRASASYLGEAAREA